MKADGERVGVYRYAERPCVCRTEDLHLRVRVAVARRERVGARHDSTPESRAFAESISATIPAGTYGLAQ